MTPGEWVLQRGLYYKGKVKGNVAGEWEEGFKEPLWVITNLDPEEGLELYRSQMKIDESFKDLKSLLDLEKVMNKKREQMEKVVALVLLAYAIGLLMGEACGIGSMAGEARGGVLIPRRGGRDGTPTRVCLSCSGRSSGSGKQSSGNLKSEGQSLPLTSNTVAI